jgi:hypothetical protein
LDGISNAPMNSLIAPAFGIVGKTTLDAMNLLFSLIA